MTRYKYLEGMSCLDSLFASDRIETKDLAIEFHFELR